MNAEIDQRAAIAPQIYRALRQAIVTMELMPGQALSEKEIATLFGVSRQPVREAFIKLSESRLVSVRPQRGTFVVKISLHDVANARFVREAVEVAVARTACGVASAASIARMRAVLDDQRRAADRGDQGGFLALDEAFHRMLAQSVDCETAWTFVESVKAQMDRVRYLSLPQASPMGLLIDQHAQILDAVEARQPAAAELAMQQHLREILQALPRLSRERPELFENETLPAHALDLDPSIQPLAGTELAGQLHDAR